MKNNVINRALMGSCLLAASALAAPVGTAFTYQGELIKSGSPVTDTCDFTFSLWDADAGGNEVGDSPQGPLPIAVENGIFTATIDFDAGAITGEGRWLEIEVECPGDGAPTLLTPRVKLTPAPHALALPGVFPDTASGHVGVGTLTPAEPLDVAGNIRADGTISSGSTLTLDGTARTVVSDADLEMHISSGRVARLEATATTPNVILGYSGNSVLAPFPGATISGGGDAGFENRVEFSFGTIGGGGSNLVSGHSSTVAGGRFNIAGADQSTVGGGQDNTARRNSTVAGGSGNTADNLVLGGATVGGGINNNALGGRSTVGGGESNAASDHFATVPGGRFNQAGGQFSLAGGHRAKVRTAAQVGGGDLDGDEGAFVWADSTNADFISTGPNQFLVRATGGMGLNRNNPAHPLHVGNSISNGNGAHVTAGGTWTNGSSRKWKRSFAEIDKQELLSKLAELPVMQWQYNGEDENVRHIGPVAEDFAAVFGLGHDEQYITTIDADGVALAAIQGLHEIVQETIRSKDSEIVDLKEKNAILEARLVRVEKLLSTIISEGNEVP